MNGKIRIKFGAMEIEFEGSEQFLKEEFLEMIREVCSLARETGVNPFQFQDAPKEPTTSSGQLSGELGTNTVAQKLAVKSGPELMIAAAAKLTLIDKKDKFNSKDLVSEMRKATSYFKGTFSKNAVHSINSLVKTGKLNDVGSGNYSLPANSRAEFIVKLKD